MSARVRSRVNQLDKTSYIMQCAQSKNEISITNHNSKTGVACNNLAMPTCTCRADAPCKTTGCYCMKGTQQFSNVLAAYTRNWLIYNANHEDFWEQVKFKLKYNPLPLFRFFDAGDIPDYDFIDGMVQIAREYPNIKFMSFTKKYNLINAWISRNGNLPKNLNIIFSAWGKNWSIENPYVLPVAYVNFSDKTMTPEIPSYASKCPNQSNKSITCSACQKCWNKNVKAVQFVQH